MTLAFAIRVSREIHTSFGLFFPPFTNHRSRRPMRLARRRPVEREVNSSAASTSVDDFVNNLNRLVEESRMRNQQLDVSYADCLREGMASRHQGKAGGLGGTPEVVVATKRGEQPTATFELASFATTEPSQTVIPRSLIQEEEPGEEISDNCRLPPQPHGQRQPAHLRSRPRSGTLAWKLHERSLLAGQRTFEQLASFFERGRTTDLSTFAVARIVNIQYESVISLQRRMHSETTFHTPQVSGRPSSASQSPGQRNSPTRSRTTFLSTKSAAVEPPVDYHRFVSKNAKAEIIAGTTTNRFHLLDDPREKLNQSTDKNAKAIEESKLQHLRYRYRKGLVHRGYDISLFLPCAITFSPLQDEEKHFADHQQGRVESKGERSLEIIMRSSKIRCVLIGKVQRNHQEVRVLGHPSFGLRSTATTVNPRSFFTEKRRLQMVREREEREKTSLDVWIETLGKKKAPAAFRKTLAALEKPPELRQHAPLDSLEEDLPEYVAYKHLNFIPEYMLVYNVANCDPLQLRVKSDEDLLRLASQLKKIESDRFGPLEFTTRWCSLIHDVWQEASNDGWVKRRYTFASAAPPQETPNLAPRPSPPSSALPLPDLLQIIGSGSVSIDVTGMGNEEVLFRHSFSFTNDWSTPGQIPR